MRIVQWVRSCMAINTESGLLQWVVDGALVENNIVDQIKDTMNRPTNLVGNLILGNNNFKKANFKDVYTAIFSEMKP